MAMTLDRALEVLAIVTGRAMQGSETRGAYERIRAHLLSQDAELKILRVKCSGTLANNLCPDHRDKQVGNPCLACTIEKLQSRLAAANELLRECRRMAARLLPTPHDLYEQIDAYLQGATHDRA